MKVTVDLDPRDVWRIQERAEKLGIRPGDVLRSELSTRRQGLELRERVRERVKAGGSDGEIGQEFGLTTTAVAEMRRGMGLRANPHPERGKRRKAHDEGLRADEKETA